MKERAHGAATAATWSLRHAALALLAVATASTLVTCLHWGFFVAPDEKTMGVAYKILFLHAPCAYAMYLGFGTCLIGSALYLHRGSDAWEAAAVAGAEVGMLFCATVIATGPLWGRKAWGTYWTWDPRLTSTLLIAMIYFAYLVLRNLGESGTAERRFAAGLGIAGGALIPLVHYSVQLWRGQHPTVITKGGGGLERDMGIALTLGFVGITGLALLLMVVRLRSELLRRQLDELELALADAELSHD